MAHLEVVCYRNANSSISPVKEFFKKYVPLENDKPKQAKRKLKTYAHIKNVIKHFAENGGVSNSDYFSPLHGYIFNEMRIKDSDNSNLVRILYFTYNNEKLILLNAYEKSNLYEKGFKKKTDRYIEEKNRETQIYYEDFIINPKNYDEY